MSYTLLPNIVDAVAPQQDSIISKTIVATDRAKVVLMALDSGQELSEHTATMPAIVHILEGRARVSLGDDTHELSAGAWVHMPAELRHAVRAETPTCLLLTLLKNR